MAGSKMFHIVHLLRQGILTNDELAEKMDYPKVLVNQSTRRLSIYNVIYKVCSIYRIGKGRNATAWALNPNYPKEPPREKSSLCHVTNAQFALLRNEYSTACSRGTLSSTATIYFVNGSRTSHIAGIKYFDGDKSGLLS